MNKTIILLFLGILPTFIMGQYTDVINTNKPGESFSAFSVGTNVLQILETQKKVRLELTTINSS